MVGVASFGYSPGTSWKTVPLGAGGFVTNINVCNDGTIYGRNDTGLAYKYSTALSLWVNLVTTVSMGSTTAPAKVNEIAVAPSNSNVMYMLNAGAMYTSTNGGGSWTLQSGFTAVAQNTAQYNDVYRLNGHKIAVDPINSNIALVGTGANGLFITTNGGVIWSAVTGVPVSLPDITKATSGSTKLTNAATTASNVLHFASTPTGVLVGDGVTADALYSSIPLGTTVTLISGGDITISSTVTVASNTSISFSPAVSTGSTAASLTFATLPADAVNGRYVFNYTNPASIPAGTTVTGTGGAIVSISNTVTVATGDMIVFTDLGSAATLYPSYCLAFDPKSSTAGGFTHGIYVFAWGSPIYQSTNGGSTWSALTTAGSNSGPRFSKQIRFGPDGTLWVVSDNQDSNVGSMGNVWSYAPTITTSTVPTQYTTANVGTAAVQAIAINPNDSAPNIRIFVDGVSQSVDNGSTWTGIYNGITAPTLQAGKIPWIGQLTFPSVAACIYDPTAPNTVWVANGVGVYNGNPPTGTLSGLALAGNSNPVSQYRVTFAWTDQSAGIESLTTNTPISPIGANVIFPVYDRVGFSKSDIQAYPADNISGDVGTIGIVAGYDFCISASDPTFLAGAVNNAGTANAHTRYSTNSGATWQDFPTQPGFVGQGGTIAATTPQHIVYIGSNKNPQAQPYVTTSQGTLWALTDLPSVNGWVPAYFSPAHILCSDVNASDTMYIYCFVNQSDANTGVYKSTNGGVNWTKVISGNAPIAPVSIGGGGCRLAPVPGQSAGTLMYCGLPNEGANGILYVTTNGALTWANVNSNMSNVLDFSFGKSIPGGANPTLFVIGTYSSVAGIWRSTDLGANFTQIGTLNPVNNLPVLGNIAGDSNLYGRVYVSMRGFGFAYADYVSG